jgi:hypothetical protein
LGIESAKNGTSKELSRVLLSRILEGPLPVSTLVRDLSEHDGYKPDRIIEELIRLKSSGKITLDERETYHSLRGYSLATASIWFWTAVAATLFSLVSIFVTGGLALYLRYVFGGILVLFLPGYSLVELLYSAKETARTAKIVLSIVFSLALISLIGLVLNYLPYGINLVTVGLSVVGLTITLLVLGLARRYTRYRSMERTAS